MKPEIAIVGMACHYPDATSPKELWENVLSQRRAFRRIPSERLRLEDYFSEDRAAPDTTYATQGAFIQNYAFDRIRYQISGRTYRASDLAHWLALDVASRALADAGFVGSESLPLQAAGVIVGNTLTGEISRANSLRLRWPYVRRVLDAKLHQEGWPLEQRAAFLSEIEVSYKEPFAPVNEETLAGGLSNTIAGRICNYFDLKGGGYTVDGACSSSLLAVITACNALAASDLDLALAGGVDLSLDPFEIVGFAKTMALASDEMRIYDKRSAGFIPGEGCGFVTLMRYEDALLQQRRVYAVIRGWGISSDGSGGITRPGAEGQRIALERAYRKAGIGIESVAYFEGHGTGTSVGDAIELQSLSHTRGTANPNAAIATIGSIKANIGHTKAAAGVAGLIKATMAVYTQIIPPTTGTVEPHPTLMQEQPALKVAQQGMLWPAEQPLRAGVNAMGFGGINTHVVIEAAGNLRRTTLTVHEQTLLSSAQDAELFLLRSETVPTLLEQVDQLSSFVAKLSLAELTDLAVYLASHLPAGNIRVAIMATKPSELVRRLDEVRTLLKQGVTNHIDSQAGIFLGSGHATPRIGLLFTGQGAPVHLDGGLLQRKFANVDQLYQRVGLPTDSDRQYTRTAQPAIVMSSLVALYSLRSLGIEGDLAIGHSLGELTALYWAGAFDETTLVQMATVRGAIMGDLGDSRGRMVSIAASQAEVEALLLGQQAVISSFNAPQQMVVSGDESALAVVVARAQQCGLHTTYLQVSHAFHSPLVAAAVEPFAQYLRDICFTPLQHTIVSTVTGECLQPSVDLRALLSQQITQPVQFMKALACANEQVDLWIELGPGQILSGLAKRCGTQQAIAIDAGGSSIAGLLSAAGAAFAMGSPLAHDKLFRQRFARPIDLQWNPRFFVNPCEQAPLLETAEVGELSRWLAPQMVPGQEEDNAPVAASVGGVLPIGEDHSMSPLQCVRQMVADRAELPLEAIKDDSRMLSDLHLNSITVGQIVSAVARSLGLLPPIEPTAYADATVTEIAQAMQDLQRTGGTDDLAEQMKIPGGIDNWVHPFVVSYQEEVLAARSLALIKGGWKIVTAEEECPTQLRAQLPYLPGTGTLLYLSPHLRPQHLALLMQAVHTFTSQSTMTHFVLVQHNGEGSGLARTLFLEFSKRTVCVLDLPPWRPEMAQWIQNEVQAARGYSEVRYMDDGRRFVPQLQRLSLPANEEKSLDLGHDDVLLVTGGGKGIAAECAFSLASHSGVKLALVGRSVVANDNELAQNIDRMQAAGLDVCYLSVDVTDEAAVQQAVRSIEARQGIVTAVLHGAGSNVPRLLSVLEEEQVMQTLAPKVDGLEHILTALDTTKLRLLVTFGSVIARTGMRGEADYALANDELGRLTERFQVEHPACRCLCLEWSIWSGVGMGERLGRVEALLREGIYPIAPESGIAILHRLLQQPLPEVRIVVASRLGESATIKLAQPDLPLLRFLEQPRVYYPGIELITDVKLSTITDLYLDDHTFRGERLLPAVVGLEAMAQAAMAVTGHTTVPDFSQVQLTRPVVVPESATHTIRIVALVREHGEVEVALRSEETAFQVDHFRAICHFIASSTAALTRLKAHVGMPAQPGTVLALDPQRDIYGPLLFHRGSFQRVGNYRHLRAKESVAEIVPASQPSSSYVHYLPAALALGDFAARDAVIHAIQACIPQATVLPTAVEQIKFAAHHFSETGSRFAYARERLHQGDTFVYDVEVRTESNEIQEQWIGLHLQQVADVEHQGRWPFALLIPYLERRLSTLLETPLQLEIQHHSDYRDGVGRKRSEQALQRIPGMETQSVHHQLGGKPALMDREGQTLSASHTGSLTLAIVGPPNVGCDLERVAVHAATDWEDMLGQERHQLAVLVAQEAHEAYQSAATRLWSASECLKKAGAPIKTPVVFRSSTKDGWIMLQAGTRRIATYLMQTDAVEGLFSLAVCAGA